MVDGGQSVKNIAQELRPRYLPCCWQECTKPHKTRHCKAVATQAGSGDFWTEPTQLTATATHTFQEPTPWESGAHPPLPGLAATAPSSLQTPSTCRHPASSRTLDSATPASCTHLILRTPACKDTCIQLSEELAQLTTFSVSWETVNGIVARSFPVPPRQHGAVLATVR
jgi:hypothetical protein